MEIADDEKELDMKKESTLAYLERLAGELKGAGIHVSYEVVVADLGASTAETIIKAERELEGNMVAMSTHGRKGIGHLIFGSIAEKVMREGSIPVMTVKAGI